MLFSVLDYLRIPEEFIDEVLRNVPANNVSNVTDMLHSYLAEGNSLNGKP
jgi:hypothetical protein